jgi:hypothetical protein
MKEATIVLTMPQAKLQSLYTALDALLDGGEDETAKSSMVMMLEVREDEVSMSTSHRFDICCAQAHHVFKLPPAFVLRLSRQRVDIEI